MRLVPVVVLLAALLLPDLAVAVDDAELIDQLVARSPWTGLNIGDGGLGTVSYDITFAKDSSGRLTGVVSNYSIPAFAGIANGPVKMPSVKDGVLRFETNRGTYKLTLEPDGKWTGDALSLDRSFGAAVRLTPTRK